MGARFRAHALRKPGAAWRGALATLSLLFALEGTLCAATLVGRVVAVSDGDTITVLDADAKQHRVRLEGIDAPERGQAFHDRSRQNLAAMVQGRPVSVEWTKRDRYGRVVGRVFADGHDVNLLQIEMGYAWHFKPYAKEQEAQAREAYAAAEEEARAVARGLWSGAAPVPPGEWRARARRPQSARSAEARVA